MAPFYWVCLAHLISSHVAYLGDPKIRSVVVKWLLFTSAIMLQMRKTQPQNSDCCRQVVTTYYSKKVIGLNLTVFLKMWRMSGNLHLIAFLENEKMLETTDLNGGPLDFSSRHCCEKVTRMLLVESTQRTLSILN
jgi:hypothetical protein